MNPCRESRHGLQRWYLIRTKPLAEPLARANLERQGYETYLPLIRESVRGVARHRERVTALFPRYLFLRLQEGRQSLAPVRSSVGVASIVRFGLHYTVVPDEVVRDLRAREDPTCGLHRLNDPRPCNEGDRVAINGGPFDGLQAIFHRRAGADRVIVLLRLLGQEVTMRLPMDCLRLEQRA